jgi:hypothetical protein
VTGASGKAPLLAATVLALAAAGCLAPHSIACSDGRFCPAGTECDVVGGGCISAAEKAACANHAEGDECTLSLQHGACQGGVCRPFSCGDGVRTTGEECDKGDLGGQTCVGLHFRGQTTGLSCNSDCTFNTAGCTGICGDGVRTDGEACEGADLGGQTCTGLHFYGETISSACSDPSCTSSGGKRGLACNADCTFNTTGCTGFCGDGMVNGPEQCDGASFGMTVGPSVGMKSCVDYGFDQGFVGCSDTCTVATDGCSKYGGWNVVATSSTDGGGFKSVWGSGPDDVYAAGLSTVLHWNGTSWSDAVPAVAKSLSASGFTVWGTGPSDVYLGASARGGLTLFHWDGSAWTSNQTPESATLAMDVWASGPSDVYLAGYSLWHWDGKGWSVAIADGFQSVWGTGPHDVFALGNHSGIGKHWDGLAWSDMGAPLGHAYSQVWGPGRDELFGLGVSGGIDHWDGTAWSPMPLNVTGRLVAISGRSSNDVVAAVSDGTIIRWDGTQWKKEGGLPTWSLIDVWEGPGGAAFAVGYSGGGPSIMARSPNAWGTLSFAGTPPALNGVWSSGPDDLFAVGDEGTLAHWDGIAWSTTALDPTLPMRGVWGNAPDDVWAVGDNATGDPIANLAHWDGLGWSRPPNAPSVALPGTLRGVWNSSPTDVYLVGESQGLSCVLHWDGTTWTALANVFPTPSGYPPGGPPLPNPGFGPPLNGVWGSGRNDVYVYGDGEISHWDGSKWTVMGRGASSIWGSSAGDDYAVMGSGASAGGIYHWDSSGSLYEMPADTGLLAAGGSTAADVFAGGDDLLLHRRAGIGIWERIALPVAGTVHGLWVTPSRVTVVGTMGEIHLDRASVTCVGPERNCNDGWDNDCDGLADTDDPDCAGKVPEQCANGLDDDGDGLTDCLDPDCKTFPACKQYWSNR